MNILGGCPDTNGINVIANLFCSASNSWLGNALQSAQRFFILLVGIELAWAAILWVFQKENLGELLASFILKMMGVWFFYGLLVSAVTGNWLPAIMQSFIGLGGQVTGRNVTLDPMSILQIGINICNAVFSWLPQAQFGFSLLDIGGSINNDLTVAFAMFVAVIFAAIVCLMVFLSFLIAAGQLIMTLIEAYIMVGAGAVFLGFTGSRWTISFGEKWISYAFAIGVKLFVTVIIVGLGVTLFPTAAAGCGGADPSGICQDLQNISQITFANTGDIAKLGNLVVDYLIVGAVAVIFMMLTMRLPGLAASMMNGSPNLTLAGAISTAQSVVGAVTGAASAIVSTAQTVGTEGALAVADAAMLAGGAGAGGGGAEGAAGGADIGGSGAAGGDVGGSSIGGDAASDAPATDGGASSSSPISSVPVLGHAAKAAAAPIGGTFAAASAAFSPLSSIDEGGGGGTVSIGLRIPE